MILFQVLAGIISQSLFNADGTAPITTTTTPLITPWKWRTLTFFAYIWKKLTDGTNWERPISPVSYRWWSYFLQRVTFTEDFFPFSFLGVSKCSFRNLRDSAKTLLNLAHYMRSTVAGTGRCCRTWVAATACHYTNHWHLNWSPFITCLWSELTELSCSNFVLKYLLFLSYYIKMENKNPNSKHKTRNTTLAFPQKAEQEGLGLPFIYVQCKGSLSFPPADIYLTGCTKFTVQAVKKVMLTISFIN